MVDRVRNDGFRSRTFFAEKLKNMTSEDGTYSTVVYCREHNAKKEQRICLREALLPGLLLLSNHRK